MPKQSDKQNKKILVLQTAFIGDVILATALVRAISQSLPSAELHFLTIPASREVAETLPFLKKLWIYDKRGEQAGIVRLIQLSSRLKNENFDVAVVPHRSLRSALLVFLAGIPRRIGFDNSVGSFLFTEIVKYPAEKHEIERNLELVKSLLKPEPQVLLPQLFSTENDAKRIDVWLAENAIGPDDQLVCLAPGSVWSTKRWPVKYWKQLADMLLGQGLKIALIGGPGDEALAADIIKAGSENIFNCMGKYSLRQSSEIIRRAGLLITNDSAPTHMGVAVETPVLTLYGSTAPKFGFYPYGSKNRILEIPDLDCRPCTDHGKRKCPLDHFKCMLDLKPETVYQTAREMIDENLSN